MERNVPMKKRIIAGLLCGLMILSSCVGCQGSGVYEEHFSQSSFNDPLECTAMASDLAVISKEEGDSYNYDSEDGADLLVNDTTNEVIASRHCFDKRYPASITKIMTALLTLEKGNLGDTITLDHDIVMTESGAVISTLSKGDTVTVDQVFHTMLIKSANDCAVILAEYIAGSEEEFAKMMTERAKELGATSTSFKNSNGLHLEGHYTTAYDLYLIFKECVKHQEFVDTISMSEYVMTYTNAEGQEVNEYVSTTNHYLSQENPVPDGVIMYGGKTGTTSMAGSCLILMTENTQGEVFFAVVLGAMSKDQLYGSMTELLEKTAK